MIAFEEAYKMVVDSAKTLGEEQAGLDDVLGRVLSQDVSADMNMPPFNKAAVDGYACRRADLSEALEVIERLPAGKQPEKTIGPGECTKVMTGGVVPKGGDTVIMVEHTEDTGENHIRFTAKSSNTNICYTGEDIKSGEIVLEKGTLIRPQEIAVLASVGAVNPNVYKRPVIGVISTGDELVEPDIKPDASQIRNSNASQLVAQVMKTGALPRYFGIAGDNEQDTRRIITLALKNSDMVLLTGGVSMGDYDYVPQVLKDLGIRVQFKSLAVQPGRPTVFGLANKKYLFGLPGNPVSSFVQFELLVKPLIFSVMGHRFQPPIMKLPMGETFTRRKARRKSFIPVSIRDSKVYTIDYHGSAHIHSYVFADGIVSVEIGNTTLEKGQMVDVRQI